MPAEALPGRPRARIRTYKPRRGRVTPRQATALAVDDGLLLDWPQERIDLAGCFGGRPVILEIGFGTGAATVALAQQAPDAGILAVDVHTPGVGDLLWRIRDAGLGNVRVIEADALDVLHEGIPDAALSQVRTYFPDPWPKARHHKRRLVTAANAALVAARTVEAGMWYLATDSAAYADHASGILDGSDQWDGGQIDRPAWRPITRYEQQALDAGRPVIDLAYVRVCPRAGAPQAS
ncbi:MAG: tRNA (guanine(46)-N(7))-methyltransferase TrmB [Actinomycetales bacterium]|nr:tRNA (guanine(46)-N(7))-methyltransferase TrmB [Actinomycetales bacterium]